MSDKQKIRLKLESYDVRLLDIAAKNFLEVLKKFRIPAKGPIPLPTNAKIFTQKKSPHVYKEANEQFELAIHKRLFEFYPNSQKDVDMLSSIEIPSGVNISAKV